MLYIVSTPIGNLKDVSGRALEVLGRVDIVIAEDVRDALRLLSAYSMKGKRIVKYNDRNKKSAIGRIISLLQERDAAYISSAGTPGISDPGTDLVKAVREAGIGISVIPGPSALVSAIATSGIRAREFTFVSFLPKKQGQLKRMLEQHEERKTVLVFFESPYRIAKTLSALGDVAPASFVCVAKEMTKVFERYFTGTPAQALAQLQESPKNTKGEFTVVVNFSA